MLRAPALTALFLLAWTTSSTFFGSSANADFPTEDSLEFTDVSFPPKHATKIGPEQRGDFSVTVYRFAEAISINEDVLKVLVTVKDTNTKQERRFLNLFRDEADGEAFEVVKASLDSIVYKNARGEMIELSYAGTRQQRRRVETLEPLTYMTDCKSSI